MILLTNKELCRDVIYLLLKMAPPTGDLDPVEYQTPAMDSRCKQYYFDLPAGPKWRALTLTELENFWLLKPLQQLVATIRHDFPSGHSFLPLSYPVKGVIDGFMESCDGIVVRALTVLQPTFRDESEITRVDILVGPAAPQQGVG